MSRNFSLPIIEVEDATLQEATTQLNLNAESIYIKKTKMKKRQ